MHHTSASMQACIDACLKCYATCLGTSLNHCLEAGGKHAEPAHIKLMLSCAEMCRACAQLMLIGSPEHKHACRACADICEACAKDCERVGGMDDCVKACRACVETCRKMAA